MNTTTLTKNEKRSNFNPMTSNNTPSLRELARQLGVSPAYLSQVKNGKRPASVKLLSNPVARNWFDTNDESTHLPSITSRLRYHCATRALNFKYYRSNM